MSFGFVEGFNMGSSVVDTYLKVKRDKEDREERLAKEAAIAKEKEQKMIAEQNAKQQEITFKQQKEISDLNINMAKTTNQQAYDLLDKRLAEISGTGYDPYTTVELPSTDGKTKQVRVRSSFANMQNIYVAQDGRLVEKVSTFNNGKEEEQYIPTNQFDLSGQFNSGNGKFTKTDIFTNKKTGVEVKPINQQEFDTYSNDPNFIRGNKPAESNGSTKRDSLEQKYVVRDDLKKAQAEYNANPTPENAEKLKFQREIYDSQVKGKSEASEYDEKTDIKRTLQYGRSLSPESYSTNEAMDMELDFKYTKAYQQNTKLKNEEDEFNNAVVTYNQTKQLSDALFSAVEDGSYKSGIIDSTIKKVASYTTKDFSSLIKLDRESIKEQIGLEGKLGDAVAQYLKNLSGTAASQSEFERTLNNFIGNDMLNEDIRAKKLMSFTNKKKDDLDKRAKQLAKRGLVSTAGEWLYGSRPKVEKQKEDNIKEPAKQSTYKLDVDSAWERILKNRQGL